MGVGGNLPIALAPGMGLNAYFTYNVVGYRGEGSVSLQMGLSDAYSRCQPYLSGRSISRLQHMPIHSVFHTILALPKWSQSLLLQNNTCKCSKSQGLLHMTGLVPEDAKNACQA